MISHCPLRLVFVVAKDFINCLLNATVFVLNMIWQYFRHIIIIYMGGWMERLWV